MARVHEIPGYPNPGYPSRKSFRRDILAGYLESMSFVFIDLAGKRIFGVYAR